MDLRLQSRYAINLQTYSAKCNGYMSITRFDRYCNVTVNPTEVFYLLYISQHAVYQGHHISVSNQNSLVADAIAILWRGCVVHGRFRS